MVLAIFVDTAMWVWTLGTESTVHFFTVTDIILAMKSTSDYDFNRVFEDIFLTLSVLQFFRSNSDGMTGHTGRIERQINMTEEMRKTLIKAQQGELDGVETYLMLAEVVHNEEDVKAFKELAADEGRHAAVFKNLTGEVLKPKKTQAFAVAALYSLLGKKTLYPLIAKFEYAAIPGYEDLMKDFPEVESVKNDEKRHGDTLNSLLTNGQYNDKPKLPYICAVLAVLFIARLFRRR